MNVFETETMAELCLKQGHVAEGLAIYRRLVDGAPDGETRARRVTRLGELERGAASLTLERRGDLLTFAWTLPPDTSAPALQLLLVVRGPDGIEAETRTLPLDGASGTTTVNAPALHSVHAAVGRLEGSRFLPLARLPM